ncbi:MAG: response regulator [Candidatus Hatepunaea meridiana]|nr:response regulator [Candidatus Hatepunaea meridiana]
MNSLKKTKRILIADDEEYIRDLLRETLVSLGYEVEVAQDGFEALSKLVFDIDLVMLDVEMPRMDGYEVAQRIRNDPRYKDLPIIFATGMESRRDRLRAVEAGGNDFIAKPLEITEISVRTSSLLQVKEANDALKHHKDELEQKVVNRTAELREALENMVKTQRLLVEANLETIHCLVSAAEYKDKDTAGHIKRMSHFSSMLARKIQLPPGEVELILNASPMHDIGKIGTPEEILLKPEKLSLEECRLMKQHTIYGSEILSKSNSDLLQIGKLIALTHHEKWDGSGYPNGLKGKDIPIFGRICAVADVFDALSSKRPYKEAFSNEEALRIIHDSSGTHLDPELVDTFTESIDEIVKIQNSINIEV